MIKKLSILLLALLLTATALAEVYEGQTVALSTTAVTAGASGMVQSISAVAGSHMSAGEGLVTLKPERAFATRAGVVSLVNAQAGDKIDGTLLELMPLERYLIHCTVDKAYQSAETTLVHSGETVYARCTTDGSHRAIGVITQIDGEVRLEFIRDVVHQEDVRGAVPSLSEHHQILKYIPGDSAATSP